MITRDEVSTWPDYDSGICKRMVEQTNAGPIGFHELSEEEADIANCTIGFLNVTRIGMDENADTIGSGTLVRIGSTSGVLTAAHVLDALPQNGQIGLVTFNRPGKIQKQSIVGAWDAVKLHNTKNGPSGPDIGLLRLPNLNVSNLNATHRFLHLKPPPDIDELNSHGWDAFVGVVDEWTQELESIQPLDHKRPSMRRKQFKLLLSAGTVRALREEGGFDLFNLKPSLPMPPASYGGVSGGAVWRFLTERNGDQLVVTGKQLIGVPFYEIGPDDGPLDLICHGPQSIYNRLAKVVIDKWG